MRRSVDGDFIHANVDIDLIISEDQEFGSTEKPIEIFHIMEHFCLGRRRLFFSYIITALSYGKRYIKLHSYAYCVRNVFTESQK